MTRLERALRQVDADLRQFGASWALIGGLAINVYANPRTTQDIDLALSVESDREAEALIQQLLALGYTHHWVLEQEAVERLAGVRLEHPAAELHGVGFDLLFASSGIEREVVAAAQSMEILEGLVVPVAQLGHLIALKVLAGRDIDRHDARSLITGADADQLGRAAAALALIVERGFHRGRSLAGDLRALQAPPREP